MLNLVAQGISRVWIMDVKLKEERRYIEMISLQNNENSKIDKSV